HRILMDDHLGFGKGVHQPYLDRVGNVMRGEQRDVGVDVEMHLHENLLAGAAGAKVMDADNAGLGKGNVLDLLALLLAEFLIHQLGKRGADDLPGAVGEDERDADGNEPVGIDPAELRPEDQGGDHSAVNQQVADIMQRVGGNGDRGGAADDMALIGDEGEGEDDGENHHDQPDRLRHDRFGVQQPLAGLKQKEGGGADDDRRLEQPGERLRLA